MDSFKSMKEKNMLEREEATFLDKINSFKSMKEKKLLSKRFRYSPSPNFTMNETERVYATIFRNKLINEEYNYIERPCPVCDLSEFLVIGEKDRCGLPVFTVLCKVCGLWQTNPRPRDIDYRDFYQNYFRYIWGKEKRKITKEVFHNCNVSNQYEFIMKENPDLKEGSKILDFGCGAGSLVYKFSKEGYDCIGIDDDGDYLEYGKSIGLNLLNCSLGDLDCSKKYALIIMNHSLEHLSNPNQYLKIIYEMLEDSGRLYVEVPSVRSARFGTDLMHAITFPHIFGFTLQSLVNLLGKQGFSLYVHEGGTGVKKLSAIFKKQKHF
jgi:2-polyprenyl-3-methyl-5-hydroxy-6-metoxy-1,4-benzoquinol methylase